MHSNKHMNEWQASKDSRGAVLGNGNRSGSIKTDALKESSSHFLNPELCRGQRSVCGVGDLGGWSVEVMEVYCRGSVVCVVCRIQWAQSLSQSVNNQPNIAQRPSNHWHRYIVQMISHLQLIQIDFCHSNHILSQTSRDRQTNQLQTFVLTLSPHNSNSWGEAGSYTTPAVIGTVTALCSLVGF